MKDKICNIVKCIGTEPDELSLKIYNSPELGYEEIIDKVGGRVIVFGTPAETTLTDYAKEQMRNTVAALALTAYRVMADPALYAEIHKEFINA